ncbi:MAG: TPM domain-containing protein [Candidatus Goldiibacteriota bacterium]
MKPEDFFSKEDIELIEDAIKYTAARTSGRIVFHVEKKSGRKALQRAKEIFVEMGMREPDDKNSVLFLVTTADKRFTVVGDDGINEKVTQDFWDNVVSAVTAKFREKEFGIGLVGGINLVAEKLAEFFPVPNAGEDAADGAPL